VSAATRAASPAPVGGQAALEARRGGRMNVPLVVGLALVSVLVVLAWLGPGWAPHDPMKAYPILRDEAGEWHRHPLDPGELPQFPLGTDYDRRDILSRFLWAFRPTLLMAAFAAAIRLALGTTLGLLGGWLTGRLGSVANGVTSLASTVPLLVLAILLIYLTGRERSLWQFVFALSVTGWATTAYLIGTLTRALRGEPYIEAARSLGAGGPHILRHHVLPQVRGLLPVVLAFEIGAVLLVLGELGFLGLFVGGAATRAVADGASAGAFLKLVPGMPELSQMLSVGWDNFFQTPWLSLYAGLAFFFAVFSFMLLGEGLKRRYADARRASEAGGSV
jgi:ABC-type dipeptide/oligopeptide/nickel transport system permease subunit